MAEPIKVSTFLNSQRNVLIADPRNGANQPVTPSAPLSFALNSLPGSAPDIVLLEPGIARNAAGDAVANPKACTVHAVPGATGQQNGIASGGHISASFSVTLQDAGPVTLNLAWGTAVADG